MRKTKITNRKKFLPVFIFTICTLICFSSVLYAAQVIAVKGRVQIKKSTQEIWRRVRVGAEVDIGDSIRTARKSMVDITLDEAGKDTLRIDEETLVVIDSSVPGYINRIDLSEGKVYAQVEKVREGLTFEVSTPSSVAGVRGTGFSAESQEDQDSFAVFAGEIFVKAYDAAKKLISEVKIPEGFMRIVRRFQRPSDLMRVTEREQEMYNDWREDVSRDAEKAREEKAKEEMKKTDKSKETVDQAVENIQDQMEEIGTEEKFEGDDECGGHGH